MTAGMRFLNDNGWTEVDYAGMVLGEVVTGTGADDIEVPEWADSSLGAPWWVLINPTTISEGGSTSNYQGMGKTVTRSGTTLSWEAGKSVRIKYGTGVPT